jgi:hypothetical protein
MTECELVKDNFESRLIKIQNVIEDFDLDDLSNLNISASSSSSLSTKGV